MTDRFERPAAGPLAVVRFPSIVKDRLASGLTTWLLPFTGVPVASVALVIRGGTSADPLDRPGLVSLTGDLIDEGAGQYGAIELAEAFARLGTELGVDVGADATTLTLTCVPRVLPEALALLADVVARPRLGGPDFERVRDLRLGRLRQLSRSASAAADRTFVEAVFRGHPYGHGSLGTTRSLGSMAVDEARQLWERIYTPARATLVIASATPAHDLERVVTRTFGDWSRPADGRSLDAESDEPRVALLPSEPRVLFVERPGSPQSELRVGHLAPVRHTPLYHGLIVWNAVVGGQFTSRINRRLREEKGVTYGARSSFDLRRDAGSFSCDTSVQTDRTAESVHDILTELDVARTTLVPDAELAAAKASLTRGYVRHFETAGQLARAAAELVTLDLPDDEYDRFVPTVASVTSSRALEVSQAVIDPREATVVVVGDEACRASLDALGRPVVTATPEF